MSYTTENIGERIRKCRREHGLTQERLSEMIDIAPNYLGQIENGRRGVNLTNLVKIANALGVTFDYLMSDVNSAAIEESDDIKKQWLALIENRSPNEQRRLIKIVTDLSDNLFE
ncbi:MAG: helix-turn-helix domain-containing protein [Firmicutes bacterium]|nr:helix-turn-helix domain-containing protein [Bacillota bacterium]